MKSSSLNGEDIPHINNAFDVMKNCDQMNVLVIKSPNALRQCTALVGG